MKLITELSIEEAADSILAELLFYAKHNMIRSPEQIVQIIAEYSDNDDRTIEINTIVLSKLKRLK